MFSSLLPSSISLSSQLPCRVRTSPRGLLFLPKWLSLPKFTNFSPVRSVSKDGNTESLEVPKSVPVRVAHELLQAGHRYLDVRTPEEFLSGHALGTVNVPYMFAASSGMAKNPNFVDHVSSHFGKDTEIIVGCQSGKRSLMAASELASAFMYDRKVPNNPLKSNLPEYLWGFTGITDIAGGYGAWIQNGLPTQ